MIVQRKKGRKKKKIDWKELEEKRINKIQKRLIVSEEIKKKYNEKQLITLIKNKKEYRKIIEAIYLLRYRKVDVTLESLKKVIKLTNREMIDYHIKKLMEFGLIIQEDLKTPIIYGINDFPFFEKLLEISLKQNDN